MTTIERHDAKTEPDGSVQCSCGFKASALLFAPRWARRVAFAHLAAPGRPTIDLLGFVAGGADHDAAGDPPMGSHAPPETVAPPASVQGAVR